MNKNTYIVFLSGPLMGKMFLLDKKEMTLGSKDADIKIADPLISPKHALILLGEEDVVIEDLNSKSGTFIRGERIKKHKLKKDDVVDLSKETRFRFALGDEIEQLLIEKMYGKAQKGD